MKALLTFILFSCTMIVSCNNQNNSETETITQDNSRATTDRDSAIVTSSDKKVFDKDSILLKLTDEILIAFKNKEYAIVSNHISPVSGLRFSPYAYVDTNKNIVFSKEQFLVQISKQDKINWGEFDGSGEPIQLTLNEYIKRFVYDVDFSKPEKRSVNKFLGGGNSLNNLLSVYKNCDFTESYFSGFDKKYEGMDWKTLRLVFKETEGKFFLVGMVHDQWTI